MSKTIVIVSGESSGELYGALLAREIKALRPDIRIMGVGGSRMAGAGVEVFSGVESAFGTVEVVSKFKKIRETFRKTVDVLRLEMPALVVLIDYPDFNFRVAQEAKALGIKVLYYVSPQLWAWRKGRINIIGRLVDRMAVILPFEEELYGKKGIPCEFVGHPILEDTLRTGRQEARTALGIEGKSPVFTLMPGSRPSELQRLMGLYAEIAGDLRREFPDCAMVVPRAPNTDFSRYSECMKRLSGAGAIFIDGDAPLALSASDAAVVTSGTSTLQAAVLEVPMAVVYKVACISYIIGKAIVDVQHISLPNILSGRTVVQEFIQGRAERREVVQEMMRIIIEAPYREKMIRALSEIHKKYEGKSASKTTAKTAVEMTGLPA